MGKKNNMKIYEEVKEYLERVPLARERKNRGKAILKLMAKKYPSIKVLDIEYMEKICKAYETYNRNWRLVTSDYKELRGEDYDDKDEQVDKVRKDLGY